MLQHHPVPFRITSRALWHTTTLYYNTNVLLQCCNIPLMEISKIWNPKGTFAAGTFAMIFSIGYNSKKNKCAALSQLLRPIIYTESLSLGYRITVFLIASNNHIYPIYCLCNATPMANVYFYLPLCIKKNMIFIGNLQKSSSFSQDYLEVKKKTQILIKFLFFGKSTCHGLFSVK